MTEPLALKQVAVIYTVSHEGIANDRSVGPCISIPVRRPTFPARIREQLCIGGCIYLFAEVIGVSRCSRVVKDGRQANKHLIDQSCSKESLSLHSRSFRCWSPLQC